MQSSGTYLFIPCLIDALYPEVGTCVVKILRKCGINPVYPTSQTCCGQPVFNAGHRREAIIAAKKFIEIFEKADYVVCPSGSCVNMVKNHYPLLFCEDSRWLDRATQVGDKIFEFSQFLVDIMDISDFQASFQGTVTYQDSCHLLRGLGIKKQPRALIQMVQGVRFEEMKDSESCCGFGGAFAFKHPEVSTAVLEEKVDNIIQSGADAVIGCDMSCLMNIEAMLGYKGSAIKVLHIAQLLNFNSNRSSKD